ncbi:MAG: PEGA domain-containing protein [Candidatus Pacebacteria bacterium]|nr:PEGA domain-containing protein [Candidatus Paceibacterota bacterium]
MFSRIFTNRLFITICSASIILVGTYVAIQFAKGYRPTKNGNITSTGLLSANSFPNGAQMYLNGKLATATDTTLNLEPGSYTVEIKKDGYTPWKKQLTITKELVTQTNAFLFPTAPSLTPITYTGASNVTPSPDGQKIVYYTASASSQVKNGLYVVELSDNVFSLQKGTRQISQEVRGFDLSKAKLLWSPDASQILVSYDGKNVIVDPTKMNPLNELPDVSYKLPQTFSEWEEDLYKRERARLAKFPEEIQRIATESAQNVYFSPDDERVLYTATQSAFLPDAIVPEVPAASTQPQERTLVPGGIYVYDHKEDRNFRIGTENIVLLPTPVQKNTKKKSTVKTPTQFSYPRGKISLAVDLYTSKVKTLVTSPLEFKKLQANMYAETIENFHKYYSGVYTHGLQWLPDSKHLLGIRDDIAFVKEYDGMNETVLYSGSLSEQFVYPWPNGSKLIILTRINQASDNPTNLYAISLK